MKRSNLVDLWFSTRNSLVSMRQVSGFVLSTLLATFLSGCLSNVNPITVNPITYTDAALPDPAKEPSAIEFGRDLKHTTATLLDKVIARLPSPAHEQPDYMLWGSWWCPRHRQVNSPQTVQQQMTRYCQGIGGTAVRNACINGTDENDVKFYAVASTYGDCQNVASPVGLQIYEPKPGQSKSPTYLAAIHEAGFQTSTEIAFEQSQRKWDAEKARMDKQAEEVLQMPSGVPAKASIGAKLCKVLPDSEEKHTVGYYNGVNPITKSTPGKAYFTGFLEGRNGARIQIRISGISFDAGDHALQALSSYEYAGSHVTPNSIIWENARDWGVCIPGWPCACEPQAKGN